MRASLLLLAACLAAAPAAAQTTSKTTVSVVVDSANRRVVITAGPFDLAEAKPMPGMAHDMMHMTMSPMMRFEWPVDGWLNGVNVKITTGGGDTVPIRILHHMPMFNFDRRSLVHTMVERLFSWGQDTKEITLPAGVATPLPKGDHLGFVVAWHNDTGQPLHDAYLHIYLTYLAPQKVKAAVIPWYVDVWNVYGGQNDFDLPPGPSTQRFYFQVPVAGRIIAMGGHMHDYGQWVALIDSATGKTLVKLRTDENKQGHITETGRFVFGFNDDALPIKAHHTYIAESHYDNISGKAIPQGGMGLLAGVFEPADLALLPKLDLTDPNTVKDLKSFPPDLGDEDAEMQDGHDHMHMDMPMPKDSTGGKPPRR
ncbi:MAG TPA: hypothetical protein VMT93_06480 [Gemmatimonadaceae bacterium]|nr:hypothetical protein [Gemmatimonadaceae bacterium]